MFRFDRLTSKLLLAIILWLTGALFFVSLTLNLTWGVEDRGVAINEAGSLRKQTYLMVIYSQSAQAQALQQELALFERKLSALEFLQNRSFFWSLSDSHSSQLDLVKEEFQVIRALLLAGPTAPSATLPTPSATQSTPSATQNTPNTTHSTPSAASETSVHLLNHAQLFIEHIDDLVKSIELENTRSIKLVQLAQLLLIVMVLVSAFISLALLNRLVIRPLLTLKQGIQEITAGNLSLRLHFKTRDEFSQISEGFNQMASSLQDFYQHLEEKVEQKTLDLARTNEELSVLYQVTSLLHQGSANEEALTVFLEKVVSLAHAQAGSVRLLDEQGKRMDLAASVNLPESLIENEACVSALDCLCGPSYQHAPQDFEHNKIIFPLKLEGAEDKVIACKQHGFNYILIYPIELRDQEFGLLTFYFEQDENQLQDELPLIKLLCSQLAVAIENERLALKEQQLAVLEERNIMAQGLHDSIAQSLSFLNIQLQLLKQALDKGEQVKVEKRLEFLNLGIQQCYDDVRELLNNFRFKLTKGSFESVLKSVTDRFKIQCSTDVDFNYASNGPDLSPIQQLQLVFIVQEALSNVRKHAQANRVKVEFKNTDEIYLCIQDDGVGFDINEDKEHVGHHIGLSIMRERAARIGGKINIHSAINQGTTIEVIVGPNQR